MGGEFIARITGVWMTNFGAALMYYTTCMNRVAHLTVSPQYTLSSRGIGVIRFIPVRSLNERVLESQSTTITTCLFSGHAIRGSLSGTPLTSTGLVNSFQPLALFGQLMHRLLSVL